MRPIARRRFLTTTAAACGAVLAARARTVASGGFRLFGCDWTLGQTSRAEAFPLAARIGLDGVQVDFGRPSETSPHPPLLSPEHQDRILAAAAGSGVAIASLALGVLNQVPYKSDPAPEQWVRDAIPVMLRMRQKLALLAFFGQGDLVGDEPGIAEVIRRLRRLAPAAEDAGVVFGIESWLKVPELERILDAVRSPAIRVYYDVGNMQKVGEDVGAAIRRLGRERICEIHFKDYDDLYGRGSMDFPKVRTALDTIGYRGWLGIEGIKTPLGIEASLRHNVDYLRPLFPRAA
jgi:L-ribulose-5-phosphate 3-epimerase